MDNIKMQSEVTTSHPSPLTTNYSYTPYGEPYSVHLSTLTSPRSTSYYFHLNAHGDVVSMTDTSGREVVSYSYSPWGNVEKTRGLLSEINPIRFAGYYYDSETGMYYLINRYYEPSVGRFISKDGVDKPDTDYLGKNKYLYCNDDPVNKVDPDGRDWYPGEIGDRLLFYRTPIMEGNDVIQLNEKLGRGKLAVFDQETKEALIRYQKKVWPDNQKKWDGKLGPETFGELFGKTRTWGGNHKTFRTRFLKEAIRHVGDTPFTWGGCGTIKYPHFDCSGIALHCASVGLGYQDQYRVEIRSELPFPRVDANDLGHGVYTTVQKKWLCGDLRLLAWSKYDNDKRWLYGHTMIFAGRKTWWIWASGRDFLDRVVHGNFAGKHSKKWKAAWKKIATAKHVEHARFHIGSLAKSVI